MENNVGIVGIRLYSQTNEWMDCLVLVQADREEEAIEALSAGVDAFWEDGHDMTYGECIGESMDERGIPYAIQYFDEEAERYEQYWEGHLSNLQSIGIRIVAVTS